MRCREVKRGYSSAVSGECSVTLDISKEEADELRAALKIVDKYKNKAIKEAKRELKYNITKDSDWHMIGYAVKNDCVIVTIEDGACG